MKLEKWAFEWMGQMKRIAQPKLEHYFQAISLLL